MKKLHEKERQLSEIANNVSNSSLVMTSSWHQAINEAKRQYEADRIRITFFPLKNLNSTSSIISDLKFF
jgi:hypothetical protein